MIQTSMALVLLPCTWPNLPPMGLSYLSSIADKYSVLNNLYDLNLYWYNKSEKESKKKWTFYDIKASQLFYERLDHKEKNFMENQLDSIVLGHQIIGFSVQSTNKYLTLKIVESLKCKYPDRIFIAGGPEVTLSSKAGNIKDMNSIFDFLFVGNSLEGFSQFCEIIAGYSAQEFKSTLGDLIGENIRGKIILTTGISESRNKIFPDFSRYDLKQYPRQKALPVKFSSGCIGKCRFCTEKYLENGYYVEDIDLLTEHIFSLQNLQQVKWLTFFDSMINGNPGKLKKLLNNFYKTGCKFYWDAQMGIKPEVDDETLDLMKKTGCINLFVGLESGSRNVLKLMNKLFTIEDAEKFFKRMHAHNLHFEISLIIGFPGESEQDFNDTLEFLQKNKKFIPKIAQVNPFIYYDSLKKEINRNFLLEPEIIDSRYLRMIDFLDENRFTFTKAYLGNLQKY